MASYIGPFLRLGNPTVKSALTTLICSNNACSRHPLSENGGNFCSWCGSRLSSETRNRQKLFRPLDFHEIEELAIFVFVGTEVGVTPSIESVLVWIPNTDRKEWPREFLFSEIDCFSLINVNITSETNWFRKKYKAAIQRVDELSEIKGIQRDPLPSLNVDWGFVRCYDKD